MLRGNSFQREIVDRRGLSPERCGSPFLFDRVKKLALARLPAVTAAPIVARLGCASLPSSLVGYPGRIRSREEAARAAADPRLFLSDVTTGHGEHVDYARGSRIVAGSVSIVAAPPTAGG